MNERRQEPFRHTFRHPLPGFFQKRNQGQVSGPMVVEDISLSGIRFSCDGAHPFSLKDEVSLSFIWGDETFSANGRIIWLDELDEKTVCGVYAFHFTPKVKDKVNRIGTDVFIK